MDLVKFWRIPNNTRYLINTPERCSFISSGQEGFFHKNSMMNRKRFIKQLVLSTPAAIVALDRGMLLGQPVRQGPDRVKVGFARCSLVPVIRSSVAFRRDLESVCAVIKNHDTRVALVALDLIEMTPRANALLQRRISELTGFPEECIVLHTTHTHASPWDAREENSMKDLGDEIAKTIIQADRSAIPARLKTGNADVGDALSFQRIGYAGEELGTQSFWYGFQYRKGDHRADASALVNEMKSRWLGREPGYRAGEAPVWFDREVDPMVQTMVFEDLEENVIGTIVRFSAHAGPADACKVRKYDPDYPAVTRDHLEEALGGTAMYLSGPLGNLAPRVNIDYEINRDVRLPESYLGPTWALVAKEEKQALSERDRIGKEIALAAMGSLKGQNAEDIHALQFRAKMHRLPLDPNLPKSNEDIELVRNMLIPEVDAFRRIGQHTRELRLLANRLNWLEWTGQFVDLISREDREAGFTRLPLSALRMNDTFLAFMHSEPMAETSLELRKAFPSLNLVPVCLTGGTTQYIPTAEIMDMGGYEGRATVTCRTGEAEMRGDIARMIRELLRG